MPNETNTKLQYRADDSSASTTPRELSNRSETISSEMPPTASHQTKSATSTISYDAHSEANAAQT